MADSKFVIIDGNEVEYREGETVLQSARRAEVEIPVLCHDDRLTPAGACRICLVEVEGQRLMQPACHFKTTPGMVVRTDTPRVARNREFITAIHLADTVQDPEVAHDANPSKLFHLAERYGTAGDWTPVDSPRQPREAARRQPVHRVPRRIAASPARCAPATATRWRRSARSPSPTAARTRRSPPPTALLADRDHLRAVRRLHRRLPDRRDDREAGARPTASPSANSRRCARPATSAASAARST